MASLKVNISGVETISKLSKLLQIAWDRADEETKMILQAKLNEIESSEHNKE